MKYISTRGNKNQGIESTEAILQGIANDGGLFVPENFPEITLNDIEKLSKLDYKEKAVFILSKLLSDFTTDEIKLCVENAYSKDKFGESPVILKKLNEKLSVLELWHGPTCAFKDMALQLLPQLTTVAIKKTKMDKNILILVATSGDTGKAALEGFSDVTGTKILVFYPEDGVSDIQKLQMTTQKGDNVNVCGIYGNFDDAQNGVKAIFNDENVKTKLSDKNYVFSSANSINWGRLVPQIVYYISAYCDMINSKQIKLGDKVNFCVPTGNFGNILAAYYAVKMGLPVNKLICASNSNNVLTDFINEGIYDRNRSFYTTISPSMDILISSNLERLLFDFLDKDSILLNDLMTKLKNEGKYKISNELRKELTKIFVGGYADDNMTKKEINETFINDNYLIDPHTAVAMKVYKDYLKKSGDNTPTTVVSTADPYKFNRPVLEALGINTKDISDEFILVDKLYKITKVLPPINITSLKNKKVIFKDKVEKNNMVLKVLEMI